MQQLHSSQDQIIKKPKPTPPRIQIRDGEIFPEICNEDDPLYMAEHNKWTANLKNSLGIDLYAASLLLGQMQKCCPSLTGDRAEDLNFFLASVAEMLPRDLFEVQIVSQMIIIFDQTMALCGKVNKAGTCSEASNGNLKLIDRLMRVYAKLLEALSRYRRKGEQRIVVERLTVESGAQAIVASSVTGREGVGES